MVGESTDVSKQGSRKPSRGERNPSRTSIVSRAVPRYGLALVLVATTLLPSSLLQPIVPNAFVYLLLGAVVASAWLGRRGSGLFAVVLASAALDYLFLPPLHTLRMSRETWLYFLPFVLAALAAAWMSSTRKLAEAAQTETVRLAAAVEQAADGIVITDTSANIQYVNPAFTRMTGYRARK